MPDIPLSLIFPNPEQPRQVFDQNELEDLAQSIRENGVILPISVEQAGDHYILHDGERRLRAARLACLDVIPADVVPPLNGTGPQQRLVRALVANIQRANLTPLEEARAFAILRDEQGMTVAEISRKIGRAPNRIADRLALLELDKPIQDLVEIGDIPSDRRVTRALLAIPDPSSRIGLAQGAARRRIGIKAICNAAGKLTAMLAEKPLPSDQPPAIVYALRHTKLNKPAWDALRQVGQLPPWPVLVSAVTEACHTCALSDSASDAICRDCPLPKAIRSMLEATPTKRGAK